MSGNKPETLVAAFAGACCAVLLGWHYFQLQFMGFVEEMLFRMSYLTTGKYSNTVSMLTGFISYVLDYLLCIMQLVKLFVL